MSKMLGEQNTTAAVTHHFEARRSGQDRRQVDRRREPRYGDMIDRRQVSDRRCTLGNISND